MRTVAAAIHQATNHQGDAAETPPTPPRKRAGGGVNVDVFVQTMWAMLEAQLRQAAELGKNRGNSDALVAMLNHLSRQMAGAGQLEGLRRQQYENKVGELMGIAASAGLDWKPPGF